jgi:CheY-like chemotaxis protein
VTADAMEGEAERCTAHGMDDYLTKPMRMAELGLMLERWLPQPSPY